MTVDATSEGPAGSRTRARLLTAMRVLLGVSVGVTVTWAVWTNWEAVVTYVGRVSPWSLALCFVGSFAAPLFTLFGWQALLAGAGSRVRFGPAASIFFVGQLGKYVPGSVWSVVVQAEMGSAAKIPRRHTAIASLMCIILSAVAGVLVGVGALPQLLWSGSAKASVWVVLVAVPVILLALWPPVLNRIIALALRVMRREPMDQPLSTRAVLVAMAWFVAAWLSSGLTVWVVTRDIAPHADVSELAMSSISGFPLAAAIGMFSFILPAGFGVREGLLVLLWRGLMPGSAVTAVAMILRFIITLVDVLWALFGWLWGRAHRLIGDRPSGRTGSRGASAA